jgi:ribosomal protein L22
MSPDEKEDVTPEQGATPADAPRSEEPETPKRSRRRRRAAAEPVADQPVTEEPVAEEPEEPVAEEPVAEEPVAEQPAAEEPAAEEPAAEEPGAEEPEAARPAPPAKPAPRRRRSTREPGAPAPVVRAQAKYVRSSARKARLVCDHIRGKSVEEARAILALTPRAIAQDWSKLLESAVANAEHNHELVGEDLYVKSVHADEGPTIKRFRPRAMGRATRIRKRTSHLTILLTPKN